MDAPIAMLAWLAGAPDTGWAQAQAQAQATESPAGRLEEVIVTATRREESIARCRSASRRSPRKTSMSAASRTSPDVARFTPGVNVDNSGTNNISIRGIAVIGGCRHHWHLSRRHADPDARRLRSIPTRRCRSRSTSTASRCCAGRRARCSARGPKAARCATSPRSRASPRTSVYARAELATTQGGASELRGGRRGRRPLIDGYARRARLTVWYRHDGGWIDHVDPVHRRARRSRTPITTRPAWYGWRSCGRHREVVRHTEHLLSGPQATQHLEDYWPLVFRCRKQSLRERRPERAQLIRTQFYLPSLKIQGDFGSA